jgi:hypothetical protein
VSKSGRPRVLEAEIIGPKSPLTIGREIALTMAQGRTYEEALASAGVSRNTAAKYYGHYKRKIRAPAKRARLSEEKYFAEFLSRSIRRVERAAAKSHRNTITYEWKGFRGTPKDLRAAVLDFLPSVAQIEADRIRKHRLDSETLAVTIRYRSTPKKVRRR